MPEYRYSARNADSKSIKGRLAADSESDLVTKLQANGLYLVSCDAIEPKKASRPPMKPMELTEMCRQLGVLLRAGVSLVKAIEILSSEEDIKPKQKAIYDDLSRELRRGNSLSYAMETLEDCFPPLLISMIRAAEGSGDLFNTLERMAAHYEKEYRLKKRVSSATTYPVVVLILAVVVLIFIITFVMPKFEDMFAEMESLPALTVFMMGLSDWIVQYWYLLIAIVVGGIMVVKTLLKQPRIRFAFDKLKLKLPRIGGLISVIYTARFARSLSSLYSGGMSVMASLQAARNTIGNAYIASQFDIAIDALKRGELLSDGISRIKGIKRKLASTVSIGEETGSLGVMLDNIADSMEYDSDQAIQKLTTLLSPIMLLLVAVIVGLVIFSVLMPILNSYSLYGGDVGGV